jgi:stearoyl-CoA desaturase (Delta-9 desaturase)
MRIVQTIARWFISGEDAKEVHGNPDQVDWLRVIPFFLIHLGCLAVFWVGASLTACLTALALYWIRGISISAFYHRYFSHHAYKTSRVWQFIFALLGASAMQKGPLWWASYHRNHHRHADQEQDTHSPLVHGFLWSHMGWFLSRRNFFYDSAKVSDLLKFPELRLLDRYYFFVPLTLALVVFGIGVLLQHVAPQLNTNGWQMLVWCFFISTTALFHTTASVNSLSHSYGAKPFKTKDNGRNNVFLALLTFGEGWHNNHHYYPSSARIGFKWWEVDVTFYVLMLLEKAGIIWDLNFLQEERGVEDAVL